MTVTFVDAEPNGLAWMLGELISANLERHPDRRRLLKPATVRVEAPDAGVGASLRFAPGSVTVANGPDAGMQVRVVAASHDLLRLAATPLRLGLPDPFTRAGRGMIRRIAAGHVRIEGLLRHPVMASRLARVLSAL